MTSALNIDAELTEHFLPILAQFPDAYLAVHERKGTAIVRALAASEPGTASDVWARTFSTDEILQLARADALTGPIILVDDLLRTGRAVTTVVTQLLALGISSQRICIAVLASHANFNPSYLDGLGITLNIWRRNLSDASYAKYRSAFIHTLQKPPGPFLDSEHLDVGLQLRGLSPARIPSLAALTEVAARSGHVTVLPRPASGARISVYYPVTGRHPDISDLGFGLANPLAVRKCRLVERQLNMYSILPIYLPDVPGNTEDSTSDFDLLVSALVGHSAGGSAMIDSLFDGSPSSNRERFLRSGLLASLLPLSWLVRDLYEGFDEDQFTLLLPDDDSDSRSRLAHLRVTYPTLNLPALRSLARRVIHVAKDKAREAKGSGLPRQNADTPPAPTWLSEAAFAKLAALLQAISRTVDDQAFETRLGIRDKDLPLGIEHADVLRIGRSLGLAFSETSALLDLVLDRALFSTKVETTSGSRLARVYRPDGEVMTRKLRQERRVGADTG